MTSLALADAGIAVAGLYQLSHDAYHADPCIVPSLSSSIAAILLEQSPRHAWQAHPRLNPTRAADNREDFDIGSAAHTLMLRDDRSMQIVDADSYRSAAAKQARDAAYAAGLIPVLRPKWPDLQAMVEAGRAQIAAHRECPHAFEAGHGAPEQTLIWREGDVWCRARLDWLPTDRKLFPDYKTTGGSAAPEPWSRQLFTMGYDVQAAFYRRGIRAVLGVEDPTFVFVVQETKAPFALSVIGMDRASIDFADKRVAEAIETWAWCQKHDRWPGYPARICWAETPGFLEHRQADREVRNEAEKKAGRAVADRWLHWQAPV